MRLVTLFAFALPALCVFADDAAVDELVRKLASDDPAAREEAENRLVALGASAEARLKELSSGAEPEVRARIGNALHRIDAAKIADTDLVEMRTVRVGGGSVTAVAWGPDSSQLFTCGWGGDVRVWDAATGKLLRSLRPASGYVPGLAVSRDGKRLWISGDKVVVWDMEASKPVKTFEGGGHTGVFLSPDGARAVWLANDVRIVNAASLEMERTIPAGDDMWTDTIAFSPDSKKLLLMLRKQLAVFDLETGEQLKDHPLARIQGEGTVMSLGWLADGNALIVNREGKVAWGTHTAEAMAYRYHLSVAPDGKSFAVGGPSGEVRCLDLEGKVLASHDLGPSLHEALAWSPDGSALAASNEAGRLVIWRGQETLDLEGHTQEPERIAFSPDGTVLAACIGGLTSYRTDFVDLESGRRAVSPGLWDPQPGRSGTQFVSPDGLRVITWDGTTGKPSSKPSRERKRPGCEKIYTSPDGTLAWMEGWEVPAENRLHSFTDTPAPPVKGSVGCSWSSGAWSSDSAFVATLGHLDFHGQVNALTVVRRDGKVLLRKEVGRGGGPPCWTPDGGKLYWSYGTSLFVYDRENFDKPEESPTDFVFAGFLDEVRALGLRESGEKERELVLVHVPTRIVVRTWRLEDYAQIRLARDGSKVAILSRASAQVMKVVKDGKR